MRLLACAALIFVESAALGQPRPPGGQFSLVYMGGDADLRQAIYIDLQNRPTAGEVQTITVRKIWSSPPDPQAQRKFDNVVETFKYNCSAKMSALATMTGYMGDTLVSPDNGPPDALAPIAADDAREQKMFDAICGSGNWETTDDPYADAHRRWAESK